VPDKRKQYSCPKCGQDKGFIITSKIKGISPEDRPCKKCRTISVAIKNKGRKAWNKGIPLAQETKDKLRVVNLGKPPPNKGIKLSHEIKVKLSCINRGIAVEDFDDFTTPVNEAERVKLKKGTLRQECFKLADYTCAVCKTRGCVLNAHHLNSWSKYPELRFELSNIVCICQICHKKFHTHYGSKRNTKEQFEQFLKDKNYE